MDDLVIVDTDVVIDYFNGKPPSAAVIESLIHNNALAITTVSIFELFAGVSGKKRLDAVELFLAKATVLDLTARASRKSAAIYTQLKSKGRLIGNQDILIAGICLAEDLPLFTRNLSHFGEVPRLKLYRNT